MNRLNVRRSSSSSCSSSDESPRPLQSDRAALLKRHLVALPEKGEHGWEAISRFIQGEPLSPEDCFSLSIWLEAAGPQNIDLLSSMQALEKSFIPTLYLTENDAACLAPTPRPITPTAMLERALEKGLLFRAAFFDTLPEHAARELQTAMSHSLVTGLLYPSNEPPASSDTREWLSLGLENCPSLQQVETKAGFLPLLKACKVPEVKLMLRDGIPDSCTNDLGDVLSAGGVSSFTLLSSDVQLHCMVPMMLQRANAHLPPSRCLSALKMEGIEAAHTLHFCEKTTNKHCLTLTVQALFELPHLRELTLSDPHWLMAIPAPDLLEALYRHDLMSLTITGLIQPIFQGRPTCKTANYVDLDARIKAILQLKRQREYEAFGAAAAWFAGRLPDPLKNAIVERYQKTTTSEGSVLASLNKATAKAASDARNDFDRTHKEEVLGLMRKKEVPTLSVQSVLDNCSIQ